MYTLDPKNVHAILGGALVSGWTKGTFVKIEFNTDQYSLMVGADGLGGRARSNDRSAKITFSLMPNSKGNLVLDAAQKLDLAANAGALPLLITDLSTGDTFTAAGAWVVKDPGREFQTEIGPVEWVLETDELVVMRLAAAAGSLA